MQHSASVIKKIRSFMNKKIIQNVTGLNQEVIGISSTTKFLHNTRTTLNSLKDFSCLFFQEEQNEKERKYIGDEKKFLRKSLKAT